MIESLITINAKKIYYRSYGSGNPVVLIHGFGEDGTMWNEQVALLALTNRVIVPDLPGSGKSEIGNDMSIEGMANVIYWLLQQLNSSINNWVVIGHSMGGYVTLALAEKYPQMLAGIGLVHSTAYADTAEKKLARQRGIEFIRTNGSTAFLKQSIPNLFAAHFRTTNGAVVNAFIDQYKNFSEAALIAYYEAMMARPDRTVVLKKFAKPILFIIGKHDNAVPYANSLEQTHLPELSHLHILQSSAHMGVLEEPEKTNNALASFLQGIYV
ncbi:MAG: hypothetical protein RLZZ316_29 [Bacteroidota bacterium]|jgi:pimeloyl-ACP methyl ester carboxylesterase